MNRRTRELLNAADEAREFPSNTCGASRHVDQLARDLLSSPKCPPVFVDEPEYVAESMLATVVALWTARTELRAAKERIEKLSAPHPDTGLLDAVEAGGWHIDCAPAGEPTCWTVCTWDASQNDFDEHKAPTLRGAIERAIEETTK